MSDIIDKLRACRKGGGCTCFEAADAISLLRSELRVTTLIAQAAGRVAEKHMDALELAKLERDEARDLLSADLRSHAKTHRFSPP